LRSDVWWAGSHYGSIGLINHDSMIDKYETSVMSNTCYWPTDAFSDWTLTVDVRAVGQ